MSTKKPKKTKAAAPVAKVKPEAAPVAASPKGSRRFKVWNPDHENAARIVSAEEPAAAALEFMREAYPDLIGNRSASVAASEWALGGRVRVFLRDSKPVPYLYAEELK